MLALAILKYALALLLAFLSTVALMPIVSRLAERIGMMDHPGARRVHSTPIPRAGGIAVFLGFHSTCALIFFSPWYRYQYLQNGIIDFEWWLSFLCASSLLLIVGMFDDIRGIRAIYKLSGQVAVAVVMFMMGVQFEGILGVSFPFWLDLLATVVWFVAIINAFNLIDGYDGVAGGLAAISALGIGGTFLFRSLPLEALLTVTLIGSCAGFLRFNIHPARIFLGDAGSMFLGFTLASITLATASKGTGLAAIWVPMLALGVPVFDTFLAIWRRVARKLLGFLQRKHVLGGIMTADMEHVHHRLLRIGLTPRNVTACLYLVNSLLVLIGILSLSLKDNVQALYAATFVVVSFFLIRFVIRHELWQSGMIILHSMKYQTRPVTTGVTYVLVDLVALLMAFLVAFYISQPAVSIELISWELMFTLPLWCCFPFLCLIAIEPYRWVWTKRESSDQLQQIFCFAAWILLTLTFGSAGANELSTTMFFGLLFSVFSLLFVSSMRVLPRLVEDLMIRRLGATIRVMTRKT